MKKHLLLLAALALMPLAGMKAQSVVCSPVSSLSVSAITGEGATVSWADAEAVGSYHIFVFDARDTLENTIVTETQYAVSGLEAGHNYRVSVRTHCNDTTESAATTYDFHTTCPASITDEMMPFFTDFDAEFVNIYPACWTGFTYNPTYPDLPQVAHSEYTNPENHYMRIYGGKGLDSACYVVMPYMDSVSNKIVRASLRRNNSIAEMDLGVMTDPTDSSTFVTIAHWVPEAINSATAHYSRHEGNLRHYTGNGHYIAFRSYGHDGQARELYMDSVEVDFAPCDRADSVKIENIAFDSATIRVYDQSEANSYHFFVCNTADMIETDYNIISNAYTLTDLEPGNEYRVTLMTACPDGSETTPFVLTFRTPCEVITTDELPLTYTFDEYETGSVFRPVCWEMLDEVTYNHPVSVSGTHHGDAGKSIMMTPNQLQNQYVILPRIENLQGLMMSFFVRGNTNNNLSVGVIEDSSNAATFQPLLTIDHVYGEGWTQYMVDFSSYTGEGGRIAFKGGVIYAMDYNIFLDDIEISLIPTCPAPLGVSATNVAQTEATIVINDTASENAMYELTVSSNATSWTEIVYQPTYWMTDLTIGTDYNVSVTKLCDDGTSTFPVHTSFKTLCYPIDLVPWAVDFENPNDLDCWLVQSFNDMGSDNWRRTSSDEDFDTTYFVESYFGSGNIATNEWLITPGITLAEGATGYTLYYDYQGRMYLGTGATPRMEVRVSTTDRNDTSTFTHFITTETTFGDTWVSRTFSLDSFAGETIYIAFVRQGTYDLSQRLDNIAVRNFNMPDVEIIAPNEASTEDVTEYIAHMFTSPEGVSYTWTSSMEEAGLAESEKSGDTLRVIYHATGTDTIILIVNNGIGTDTAYAIVPVYNCAVGELPWSEDFESYSHSSNAPLAPSCWAVFGFSSYQYYYPNLNSSGGANAGHNSSHCYVVMDAGGSNPLALWILPPFEQPLDTLQVSFYANTSSLAITGLGSIEVGYVGSATNPDGFTLISGIGLDTVWQQYTVRMPAEAQGRIAFRVTSAGIVRVDDIVVDIAPEICYAPEVIIDSIGTNSVSFHVTDAEDEELTVLSYVSDGTTETQELNHSASWTIDNLEPGTAYTLYVRHICHTGIISETTELGFTTLQECTAPEGLSVTNISATGANLSWTAVPSATSYTVRVGETTYTANGTSYTLNGLTPETPYTVGVQAHCPSGDSPWSETGFATEHDNSGIGTVSDGLNVSLWPNPATDRVVVSTGAPAHVSIIDISGHTSGEWNTESGDLEINVSQMARGAYFVRICTEGGTAVVKLIVK